MSIEQAADQSTTPPLRAVSVRYVALQLDISEDQVRGLIRARKLRARCTGKSYIIPVAAVDEFLAGSDDPLGEQP